MGSIPVASSNFFSDKKLAAGAVRGIRQGVPSSILG